MPYLQNVLSLQPIAVDSIWELFSPPDEHYYRVYTSNELRILLDGDYNIFKLELESKLPFHTFVLINYQDDWYLLQSYTNVCSLNVIQDNKLPELLTEFLETGSTNLYNLLFGTNLLETRTAQPIFYGITAGKYQELPVERLIDLMDKYIE